MLDPLDPLDPLDQVDEESGSTNQHRTLRPISISSVGASKAQMLRSSKL